MLQGICSNDIRVSQRRRGTMSYEGVVGGKLKLKGKALDINGVKKKKKRRRERDLYVPPEVSEEDPEDHQQEERRQAEQNAGGEEEERRQRPPPAEDHRTAAEKRYEEQKFKLEATRLAKVAGKSHRQRVEEFNQYLANLSEHYDIPKVGPG